MGINIEKHIKNPKEFWFILFVALLYTGIKPFLRMEFSVYWELHSQKNDWWDFYAINTGKFNKNKALYRNKFIFTLNLF